MSVLEHLIQGSLSIFPALTVISSSELGDGSSPVTERVVMIRPLFVYQLLMNLS
jgi:hypothetical protein